MLRRISVLAISLLLLTGGIAACKKKDQPYQPLERIVISFPTAGSTFVVRSAFDLVWSGDGLVAGTAEVSVSCNGNTVATGSGTSTDNGGQFSSAFSQSWIGSCVASVSQRTQSGNMLAASVNFTVTP